MKNSEVFLMGVELSIDNDQFTLKAWTEDKGGTFKSLNHRLNHALKVLGGGDEEDMLRRMLHQRLDAWLDYHKTGIAPQLPDYPSENNAAYEKGFVEGMAKQMHSSVDRAVNAMVKPWQGLTNDDIQSVWDVMKDAVCLDHKIFARLIEAKLKELNT